MATMLMTSLELNKLKLLIYIEIKDYVPNSVVNKSGYKVV